MKVSLFLLGLVAFAPFAFADTVVTPEPSTMALVAAALSVYLVRAVWPAVAGYIWDNEAWFASPAFTLIHKGYLGTTILASKGTWLEGIDRHTYWLQIGRGSCRER